MRLRDELTFSNDPSEGVSADDPQLLGRELLPKLLVRIRKLRETYRSPSVICTVFTLCLLAQHELDDPRGRERGGLT